MVRNEYRGEVLQLRSDLASVKEQLEATRQEKSIMEEESAGLPDARLSTLLHCSDDFGSIYFSCIFVALALGMRTRDKPQ